MAFEMPVDSNNNPKLKILILTENKYVFSRNQMLLLYRFLNQKSSYSADFVRVCSKSFTETEYLSA